MSIQNKLKEGEFTCADAYYIWGTNNEIEFGRGKLLLHLHNIVQRIILFDHCQINMVFFLFIMKKNESLKC